MDWAKILSRWYLSTFGCKFLLKHFAEVQRKITYFFSLIMLFIAKYSIINWLPWNKELPIVKFLISKVT